MKKTEVENKGIDIGIFDVICSIQELSPIFKTLGFKFTYLGEGVAGIKMFPYPEYSSYAGRVNGGIIAALADNVMGMAAMTLGKVARTVDMSLNYFAPVFEETELNAAGYVINAGKTLIVAEASLFNYEGKLVAKSRGTFIRDIKTKLTEHSLLHGN
jgi:uncharacterized protein (TIGR00369 family)